MLVQDRQRGDTLVEVLLAVTVLAAVITATISIMNQGYASAQSSAERAEVQALINGQINVLRAARDEYIRASDAGSTTNWTQITALATQNPVDVDADGCAVGPNPFYLRQDTADWSTPTALAPEAANISSTSASPSPANGIWIEGYRYTTAGKPSYYDFYVKACWAAYGSSASQQLKSVVRLYAN